MRRRFASTWLTMAAATWLLIAAVGIASADTADAAKARALVDAAIKMTDSDQAVKLLWQATEIDPTLPESYIYLGLYYNSREQPDKVIEVYRKLAKYHPRESSAYLNIGEAYMSYQPPKTDEALASFRKAYDVDPHSSFAALRIGELLAQQGSRDEAIRFLRQAQSDSARNPALAAEAGKTLTQLGAP